MATYKKTPKTLEEFIENKKLENIPDPSKHQRISFIKSAVRIVACIFGAWGDMQIGFALLGIAEIIGIYEELV